MGLELNKMSNKEKVALMLLCIDDSSATEVFSHLKDDEVKEVTRALQSVSNVPLDDINVALVEFHQMLLQNEASSRQNIPLDGVKAAERLMAKGGMDYDDKVEGESGNKSLADMVNNMKAENLYDMIRGEHPQYIAIVLSFAKVKLAKDMVKLLDPEKKADIITRLAKLDKVPELVISQMKEMLDKQRRSAVKEIRSEDKKITVNGVDRALKMLKAIPFDQSGDIISSISAIDETLGQNLERRILVIEDLVRANDAGMRELLRSISTDELKIAIKDMPESVKNKFFQNMSTRAATILKEDMEVLQAQRVEDVERAQQVIVMEIKRLIQEGKIVLENIEEE